MDTGLYDIFSFSAERTDPEILESQVDFFYGSKMFSETADSVPEVFLALNQNRETVFANRHALDFLQSNSIHDIKGKRPGELLDCVNAFKCRNGCGTSDFCRVCGAARAIADASGGHFSVRECRIITRDNDAMVMQACATPHICQDDNFVFLALSDIGSEKHRQSLERIFCQDIMNSLGGIAGLARLILNSELSEKTLDRAGMILRTANKLMEEIKAQRQIIKAEHGEFDVSIGMADTGKILRDIFDTYIDHELARERTILIRPDSCRVHLISDSALIHRILDSMMKNALEASDRGDCITLSCEELRHSVTFSVHNPASMPKKTQLQMFQKSFSTKGAGRGIGCYSMKLFGEKYLRGHVSFNSSAEDGTIFFLSVPKRYPTYC